MTATSSGAWPELAGTRRLVFFGAAIYLLQKSHRILKVGGVDAARSRLLRPWTTDDTIPTRPPAHVLDEIDEAITAACQWLPVPMSCLPRSMTAYVLSASVGARPVHTMGVRARPFFGHAWTTVDERVIGDSLASTERSGLRIVSRFPAGVGQGGPMRRTP